MYKKKKIFYKLGIFILILFWLFSGWPQVWENPSFPPKVQEVKAQTGEIKVEHVEFNIGTDSSTKTISDVGSLNNAFFRNNVSRRTSAGPTGSTGNTNWNIFSAGAQVTDTTTLTGYRAGTQSNEVKMRGEVWRYTGSAGGFNEFIVRWRGKVTIESGSTTGSQALSGISDRNDCVPFVQGVVADLASRNDGNRVVSHAYLDSSNNLIVKRGETGTTVDVYVAVVEFTGSNWRVGHALLTSPSTGANNLTLKQNSDGTGDNFDTTDWTTAFIEASMAGSTSANHALEDTWFVIEPRSGYTTDVTITFDSTAGLSGAEVFVHVLQHDDLVVTRYTKSVSIPTSANNDVSGAGLSSLDESAIEWYVFTDGTGTAYARGATTAYLTSTTNVAEWTHRTGNTGTYRYGVIDLSGIIPATVSVTISSDGTIAYGNVEGGESKSTIDLSDTQTASNDGNTTENLNIKTSNALNGTSWAIGSSPGANVFVHEFSTNSGGNWTKFTEADSYQSLATGVEVSGTVDFDLRITVPTDSDSTQKNITITVQAVAP